eukprot:GHVN01008600.1.p1 GENE.GHVN01008600.1~~GHVN01008600.1.p1  ORF type:complete len:385 (-),score=35.68 GHVN01008600.1:189-1343(-)
MGSPQNVENDSDGDLAVSRAPRQKKKVVGSLMTGTKKRGEDSDVPRIRPEQSGHVSSGEKSAQHRNHRNRGVEVQGGLGHDSDGDLDVPRARCGWKRLQEDGEQQTRIKDQRKGEINVKRERGNSPEPRERGDSHSPEHCRDARRENSPPRKWSSYPNVIKHEPGISEVGITQLPRRDSTRRERDHGRDRSKDERRSDGGRSSDAEPQEPEKPSFEPSGLLAAETNVVNGVLRKYTLPMEAAPPNKRWRLYLFKLGADDASIFEIYRKDHYVFGKDRRVADIPLLHPTVSKQHAVLQYREVRDDVRPYLIDLESTNGTFVNDKKIDSCRYYELRECDKLRFGKSTREFVLLHDKSSGDHRIDFNDFIDEHAPIVPNSATEEPDA